MANRLYQVDGGRELRKTLRAAGNDLQDLKSAHGDVADLVTRAATPKAPHGPTGRLAASGRPGATKTAALIRFGNNSTVRYARPIHWGWPARNITAHPFAYDAAVETQPEWVSAYEEAVDRVLATIKGTNE